MTTPKCEVCVKLRLWEPPGYVDWQNWADKIIAKGHIQKKCDACGKYYFPKGSPKGTIRAEPEGR